MNMIETIKIMLDALENHTAIKHPQQIHYRDRAIEAGKTAIAEAEKHEVSQEPVAHLKLMMEHSAWEGRLELSDVLANIDEFYTHPQPKREPLTDEQVEKIIKANISLRMNLAGIRQDFEAAHGIKGD